MAKLFAVNVRTVNERLKNVFVVEADDEAVIRKFRITAADGKSYLTQFYNLDAILVGYRVDFGACPAVPSMGHRGAA